MKIEVAKSDLEHALQVVAIGSGSKGTDLTSHFVFRAQEGNAEILAYNNRLGASSPLVCKVDEDGSFTVEAARLTQWYKAAEDVALTLEAKDAVVTATSPFGSVKFRSLDPSGFPYWDKGIKAAKKTMEIEGKRLHAALSHARSFISPTEQHRPEMAVTEVRKGMLWATDVSALTLVTLKEFAKSNLRVAGSSIGSMLQFLSLAGDETVEVLEHSRSLFLRREDQSVLNVGRPATEFMDLEDIEDVEDSYWWSVSCSELERAIAQLQAGAAKEDLRLTFSFDEDTKKVVLSMTADSGSTNTLSLACPEHGAKDEVDAAMPENGWSVEYPYIQRLLSTFKGGKVLKLGLNPAGEDEGGWTRVVEDRDGDRYLTILVWMPE